MSSVTAARLAHWAFSGRPGSVLGEVFRPVRDWLDSALPDGEVTFLLGDTAGSTRMWERSPDAAAEALERMERNVAEVTERNGGFLPRDQGEGDSFFAVFENADDGAAAALELQRRFESLELPVRMALHTGRAQLRAGNYFGVEVNRCARIRCIARGSQLLMSIATHEAIAGRLPPGARTLSLGTHQLRDLSRPEELFALSGVGVPLVEV